MPVSPNITVVGAKENNLKNLTVTIPKGQLVVVTGVSGSGKSSLVFDTIAAEASRLLNETFPAFIQGFLPAPARPHVDQLEGITAAIVVGQERLGTNPRSTVGTASDATALLRSIYATSGTPKIGSTEAFSFNTPSVEAQGVIKVNGKTEKKTFTVTGGMCPECEGLGTVSELDLAAIINEELSIQAGAINAPGYNVGGWNVRLYGENDLFPGDKPVKDFTAAQRQTFLYSEPQKIKVAGINMTFEGLIPRLKNTLLAKAKEAMQPAQREFCERAVTFKDCAACDGTRLAAHTRAVKVAGKSIDQVCRMQISAALEWLSEVTDPQAAALVAGLKNLLTGFVEIGLGYLSLERAAASLSGGEAQRLKIVRHLGSSLTDVTYIFDEPTAGLHAHDIDKMIKILQQLRDKGNTVIVVEHQPLVIAAADYLLDLGPGAGRNGGELMFAGSAADFATANTLTATHLAAPAKLKTTTRTATGAYEISHANCNNLKDVSVSIPQGVLVSLTGVAGSGKSSLVQSLLAQHDGLLVDQAPLKTNRRSNPGTYTGVIEPIRKAFAKENGVKPGLFSANSEGACPACKGNGVLLTDVPMLGTVESPCVECDGQAFQAEVLQMQLGGLNIAQVLALSVAAAAEFFTTTVKIPAAAKILQQLEKVGLGYIQLGQPLTTLSGGELQRLKLANVLANQKRHDTKLLVLDEPATGLHLADVSQLLELLDQLVAAGLSVVCVEHHLQVVAHSDWVIDLGPGAGTAGGQVVFAGTPADLVQAQTLTGIALAQVAS